MMERTTRAAILPVAYGWLDVGSWNGVWELSERDAAGNAARGPAVFLDSRGSYVATESAARVVFQRFIMQGSLSFGSAKISGEVSAPKDGRTSRQVGNVQNLSHFRD